MSAALDGQLRALNAVGGAPSKSKLPEYSLSLQPAQASLKSLLLKSLGGFEEKLVYCSKYFSSCVFLHRIVTFWVKTGLAEN